MKYWRGYLVAAILALFSGLLIGFAATHTVLVDMVYPYISRLIMSFLAGWSGSVEFCLWQVLLTAGILLTVGTAVLMLLLRWNPIQWSGWIAAGLSLLFLLHTVIYGINAYASPLAEDIHLQVTEYTLSELQAAAVYYRDQANTLSDKVKRDANGNVEVNIPEMAEQAARGYQSLVKNHSLSVFAGSMQPVKVLENANTYTAKGIMGTTVPLTGESAINPETPGIAMPFAICHEMAHRMSIASDRDADLAAFLACQVHSDPAFRYSAYVTAYRTCYQAMLGLASEEAHTAAQEIHKGISDSLWKDLAVYDNFLKDPKPDLMGKLTGMYARQQEDPEVADPAEETTLCDLFVSWHIQEIVLPLQDSQNVRFDPFDEEQVDLSGIVNAKVTEPTEATGGE